MVTTHYLDEAEHCHRLAILSAGRLVALGSAPELKRRFAGRPIIEVRAGDPMTVMRLLDGMPEVEKTSVFGTAVHAVIRGNAFVGAVRQRVAGHDVSASVASVEPSLEDVFLEVAEQAEEHQPSAS
jgi:ABC-2 type transport system ATP-binding protein